MTPDNAPVGKIKRKDRPCDFCRKRKIKCYLDESGALCVICKAEGRECTFLQGPPVKKKKVAHDADKASDNQHIADNGSLPPIASLSLPAFNFSNTRPVLPSLRQTLVRYDSLAEHRGSTAFFPELAANNAIFPAFEPVGDDRPASETFASHRVAGSESALSLTETTQHHVFKVAEPYVLELIQLYFRHAWIVFPTLEKVRVYKLLRGELEGHRTMSAQVAVAPLLATMLVLGSRWFDDAPFSKGRTCPDLSVLRNFSKRALQLDLAVPRQPTINAFIMTWLYGFDKTATSFELWSVVVSLIGAVQNLGMHIDCSDWALQEWEKNARVRQFYFAFCMDKFLAHSLGRVSIIHEDDHSVPIITERHMPEGSSSHLIHLTHLALILSDVLQSLYSPRISSLSTESSNEVLLIAIALQAKLEQWHQQLPQELDMHSTSVHQSSDSSALLHLSYWAVKVSIHRACLKLQEGQQSSPFRQDAVLTATNLVQWIGQLSIIQIKGVWAAWSRPEFSIISSFLLALLFTAESEEDFHMLYRLLLTFKRSAELHAKIDPFLFSLGLSKLQTVDSNTLEAHLTKWRQRNVPQPTYRTTALQSDQGEEPTSTVADARWLSSQTAQRAATLPTIGSATGLDVYEAIFDQPQPIVSSNGDHLDVPDVSLSLTWPDVSASYDMFSDFTTDNFWQADPNSQFLQWLSEGIGSQPNSYFF